MALFIKSYLFGIMLKKCGVIMIIYQNTKGGFIDDIRNELILYLYRLPNRGYFLVADGFINVFYIIPTKDES